MIRQATPQDEGRVLAAAKAAPGVGPKVWVDWTLGRLNPAMPHRFYLAGDAVLENAGLNLVVLGTPPDEEELLAFADFIGVGQVNGDGWAPPGWTRDPLELMLWDAAAGPPPEEAPLPGLDEAPPPSEVLAVLDSNDPLPPARRDALYADLCARLNHGLAAAWGVRNAAGQLVSTAGAYCITPDEIYISGVETRPGATGRGLAAALVRRLCRRYAPRRASLLCYAGLVPYYQKLGFAPGPPVAAAKRPNEEEA